MRHVLSRLLVILTVVACVFAPASAMQDRSETSTTEAASAATDTPAGSKTGLSVGRLLHENKPQYPKKARRAKETGEVALKAVVGTDGKLHNLSVTQGSEIFADSALKAASQWEFEPYRLKGEPIEMPIQIRFTFSLSSRGEPVLSSSYYEDAPSPKVNSTMASEAMTGPSGERVYNIREGGIVPPHMTYGPDPEYTDYARRKRIQGTVRLQCVINSDGTTRDVAVLNSLEPGLDQQAIDAVRTWRFDPATKDGQPVAVLVQVEVSYRLSR